MPGTLDDPVILDPFQTIIEVGWSNFISFRTKINISITHSYAPPSSSPGTANVWEAIQPTANLFEAQADIEYDGGVPIFSTLRYSNGEWVYDGAEAEVVEGMPDIPQTFTFPYGAVSQGAYGDWQPTVAGGQAGWPEVPDNPGVEFSSQIRIVCGMCGIMPITFPDWMSQAPTPPPYPILYSFSYSHYVTFSNAPYFEMAAFNFDNMVVRVAGKGYRVIGCKLIGHTPGSGVIDSHTVFYQYVGFPDVIVTYYDWDVSGAVLGTLVFLAKRDPANDEPPPSA